VHTARTDLGRAAFFDALRSSKVVTGLTHTYYRYPARFSPEFAREAIQWFSKPGDLVLDPFMGGGTSAVEAVAEGRRFLGSDINELARFVSKVKTTLLTPSDEREVLAWASAFPAAINLTEPEESEPHWIAYQQHVPWRARKLISQALQSLEYFKNARQREFARCSVLSTAQWALDCKSDIPTKQDFLETHLQMVCNMLAGNRAFAERVRSAHQSLPTKSTARLLLCADASTLHNMPRVRAFGKPKLILTSPPYMGIHVLYHRWQILGRRETSAPYWIVNRPDGHDGAFYTFADRRAISPERYIAKLRACFTSIRSLMQEDALVVQLVAFPDAGIQLPIYLQALAEVGLQHCESIDTQFAHGVASRDVPNRRWYAMVARQSNSSKEFLLVHRLGRPY
jgi:hypothetical protein